MGFVFTIKNAAIKVKNLDLFIAGVKSGSKKTQLTLSKPENTISEEYLITHETLF